MRRNLVLFGLILTTLLGTGCARGERVVVYSSQDREFSEPILRVYQKLKNIKIDVKYDVESTKTVGLTQVLMTEGGAGRTRCDLFWNNEILNTLRLKRKGLLAPFWPANAKDYPDAFKDKEGQWYGFAARARVLLVNTELVAEKDRPKRLEELTDAKWKGKVGIAKPLSGTTATHAACLFAAWGSEKAKSYYHALKLNDVHVYSGNKQVAMAVGSGQIALGMTDTDDAMGEVEEGRPVAIVYMDRGAEELGTLYIPNTLAAMKGAPNGLEGMYLANELLGPEVEEALAAGPSAQIPLNGKVTVTARVETPKTVHAMKVDWEKAVDYWDEAMRFLGGEFGG